MQRLLASLAAGILFGLGLSVSQMVNPGKVVAFLDLAGSWDPSLAFVMVGAILVSSVGYRLAGRRPRPLFADVFNLPTARQIDGRLIGGAALFGVGWGLSGFCPGPAVASLAFGLVPALVFVLAMIAGMAIDATLGGLPARSPVGGVPAIDG
jgi:hypothetical protein